MAHTILFLLVAAYTVVLATLFYGCGSTAPARFYTLSPVKITTQQREVAGVQPGYTVGVGPVEIPDYLERPNIVTRNGENEMVIAEYDRWTGSLKQDIERVLVENLTAFLPAGTPVLSWKRNIPMDYRVAVEATRLDVIPGREVILGAQWAVFGRDRKMPLSLHTRTFTESLEGRDFNSAVSGIGKAVGRLSEDITHDIEVVAARQRDKATAPNQ